MTPARRAPSDPRPAADRAREVLDDLRSRANQRDRDGMGRFGIGGGELLGGTSLPMLRTIGRRLGTDHDLAALLWSSGVHEAMLLASIVDDPTAVTRAQMEAWAGDFASWDIVDQTCSNLFDRTPFAVDTAVAWSSREEEFVKRAAFALMAALAVHDKERPGRDVPGVPADHRAGGR